MTTGKQPQWLNQTHMAASMGVTTRTFQEWGVKPVAKIGRETFYDVASVVENRLNYMLETNPADSTELAAEKLRLTKAQADNLEIKNKLAQGKTAPIEIIQMVLSRVAGEVASQLDAVPLNIRRKHPDLNNQLIEDIKRHCVKAQNAIARTDETLDDVLRDYIDDQGA